MTWTKSADHMLFLLAFLMNVAGPLPITKEVEKLMFSVLVGNQAHNLTTSSTETTLEAVPVTVTRPNSILITVTIGDNFPNTSDISITKQSQGQTKFRKECSRSTACEAEVRFLTEKGVQAVIEIDTGRSIDRIIRVIQPFDYDGVPRCPGFYVLIFLVVVVVVVLVCLIYFCLVRPFRAQKDIDTLYGKRFGGDAHEMQTLLGQAESKNTDAAYGLALTYYYGFLKEVLPKIPETIERINTSEHNHLNLDVKDKLIVMIAESCDLDVAYEDLTEEDSLSQNVLISQNNSKNVKVYKFRDVNEREWYIMMEQPRTMNVFKKMLKDKRAVKTREERTQQITNFTEHLKMLLDNDADCRDQCDVIQFPGTKKDDVAQIFKDKLPE